MRTVIVGIGGVGGLIAGLLIKRYPQDVTTVVRKDKKEEIKRYGITVDSVRYPRPFTVFPYSVTDDVTSYGIADVVIIATKAYALKEACAEIQPVVGEDTVIIPLLNGVGTANEIKRYIHKGVITDGCIYTSAYLADKHTVKHVIPMARIFFGENGKKAEDARLKAVGDYLCRAEIDARYVTDILLETWTKYLFVCGYGSCFCYLDKSPEEIKKSKADRDLFLRVIKEIMAVGEKEGVNWRVDAFDAAVALTDKCLEDGVVPSMKRDFDINPKRTEAPIMALRVSESARKAGVCAPCCDEIAKYLKEKID